jgi:DnaK suppressor protein
MTYGKLTMPTKAASKKPAAKKKAPAKKATAARKASTSTEFKAFEPYKPKRGEQYMNEAQRAHFKQILLNWKSELMQEVDRTVSHMKDEAANFPDPADRATQEEEFSLELRTRDRERKLIKKIDGTVERIEKDDYGFCDACGVDIGIKRLEARPTATLCIDCKTLDEIKERQEMG